MTSKKNKLVGDIPLEACAFPGIEQVIAEFTNDEFRQLSAIKRSQAVNKRLLDLIKGSKKNYLLSEVIDYMTHITEEKVLDGNFNLTAFEQWLNQHSELAYEENREIRGKIVGKYIPREDFQTFFPIGQGKVHPNSHTVTAHDPPDLDSTTASFISWQDAFACRVGSGLTVWNVPKGEPDPVISRLFNLLHSPGVFSRVAKPRTLLTNVAMDLIKQDRFIKIKKDAVISDFRHNRTENHIILIDNEGFYMGDWRVTDVEAVGRIQRLLNICMHIFEKDVVLALYELFSDPNLHRDKAKEVLNNLFNRRIPEANLKFYHLETKDYNTLNDYLTKVLDLPKGNNTSMTEFFEHMDKKAGTNFTAFRKTAEGVLKASLYDNNNVLCCDLHEIMDTLMQSHKTLINSTRDLRTYLDRIGIAMDVKRKILKLPFNYVTTKAEIYEMKQKIKNYSHITVVYPSKDGRLIPVGVIHRDDLEQDIHGTVSLRDFSNYDEIKMIDSLKVISTIDHHKSTLQSQSCMTVTIADVQSCNVVLAEKAFEINDRYSTRGQSAKSIEQQIESLQKKTNKTHSCLRLLEKLYRKQQAILNQRNNFFIDPKKEFDEYVFLLNAIIDDTDLLNKSGWRDLLSVTELINRLKSLQLGIEIEILDISSYPRTQQSLRKAIRTVLRNEDLYSFYKKIYQHRADVTELWIKDHSGVTLPALFKDRKIQNAACSVSQFKLFQSNWPTFKAHKEDLMIGWFEVNRHVHSKHREVDLFVHMTSTIIGGEEAYEGGFTASDDQDELWVSIENNSEEQIARVRLFLTGLKASPRFNSIDLNVAIEGPKDEKTDELHSLVSTILTSHNVPLKENKVFPKPVIMLSFKQGALNSRKADITPFLPTYS